MIVMTMIMIMLMTMMMMMIVIINLAGPGGHFSKTSAIRAWPLGSRSPWGVIFWSEHGHGQRTSIYKFCWCSASHDRCLCNMWALSSSYQQRGGFDTFIKGYTSQQHCPTHTDEQYFFKQSTTMFWDPWTSSKYNWLELDWEQWTEYLKLADDSNWFSHAGPSQKT